MKQTRLLISIASSILLVACNGQMPQLFWPTGKPSKPAYERGSSGSSQASSRAPLDVPPELREQVSVPMPNKIATEAEGAGKGVSGADKSAVAGKAVSLHARVYTQTAAQVFSSVVDAMTALNLPVQSVDSPSGTITTEWIREGSDNPSVVSAITGIFGGGPVFTRYRYVVRVLRTESGKTQLEIRTLGQQYTNHHWVNRPLKVNVSNDLFSAVEERLAQIAKPAPKVSPVTPDAGKNLPTSEPQ